MKITVTAQELARIATLQTSLKEIQSCIATMDNLKPHDKLVGEIKVTTSCGTTSMSLLGPEPAAAFELLYGMRLARLEHVKAQLLELGITLDTEA